MKINIYPFLSFVLLLCLSMPYSGQLKSQELQPIKLQLKWQHQFQFAGYYAAKEKGYYRDAGLDVELLEGNAERPPIDRVLSGKADFGVTGSDIISAYINHKPVVVVSVIFQHSPEVFMTLSDKKISSPSDLAGKKVMASRDQGWELLMALFLKEGIPIKNVDIIDHSWNSMDLVNGKADAMSAYITVEPQYLREKGYAVSLIKPVDYGIDFYGDLLFTTRNLAEENPELVVKFNTASLKGWQYAMSHPAEMADYIMELPGVKDRGIKKENLLFEAKEMRNLILPDLVEIGHLNPGRWQNMLNIYQELGLAGQDIKLDGLIFTPPVTNKILYFDILLYTLGISALLFIVVLIGNWQLRKVVHKKTLDLQKEILIRKNAEQRLALAIEAAGMGIWNWNLETNDINYDHKWIHSLGYESESFIKTLRWLDLVHPDDQEKVKEFMVDLIEGKSASNSFAYRIKTGQGFWKWILSLSKIVNYTSEGKALNIIGTHLDIDFIKQKEIELQNLTHELRKTNNELEKFAYITSHNLRAPVVNLMSLTEMQADGTLPEELNEEINQKIRHCVKQLNTTLNDLIEIVASKSREPVNSETLHFQTELEIVTNSIEKQILNSEAKIETNFSECKKIYFPQGILTSIFLNLLTNAIKYKSNERKLVISLKTRTNKDHIVLYFSDNGIGIDMDKFGSKIFGLYQRFNTKIEGKGLGLYIIRSQIESMDGKIEVDSIPDAGTTFRIYFNKKRVIPHNDGGK